MEERWVRVCKDGRMVHYYGRKMAVSVERWTDGLMLWKKDGCECVSKDGWLITRR